MREKLGLQQEMEGDVELIQSLLSWMEQARADFTNTFRELSTEKFPAGEKYQTAEFKAWHVKWQERLDQDGEKSAALALMRRVNPQVIPRNHRVEEALAAAEEQEDLTALRRLLQALESPYEERADRGEYIEPQPDEDAYQTFCGT
jgi:uncharacterized protein YdiU (UPF0061 family)